MIWRWYLDKPICSIRRIDVEFWLHSYRQRIRRQKQLEKASRRRILEILEKAD